VGSNHLFDTRRGRAAAWRRGGREDHRVILDVKGSKLHARPSTVVTTKMELLELLREG